MSHKSKPTTRREFLVGQSALEALADLPSRLAGDEDTPPSPAASTGSYLVQVARDAMACEFQVFLNAGQHDAAVEAAISALDRVEAVEDQLTVYRPTSEISRLNDCATGTPVAVEAGLFHLLEVAQRLHLETRGAFDITAGTLAKVWGFQRRQGQMPPPEVVEETLQRVGSQWLSLDQRQRTVQFRRAGMEINFGAIGKGYALDQAAEQLNDVGVVDYLMHGGHSSILARGSRLAADQDEPGWRVALRHPLRHEIRLAEICLRDRALGTSGSGNQFFHFNGKRYGHVLDPRTGYPADAMLSATVLAPNATLADALATAFFVMGVDETFDFCEGRDDLSVILACKGPKEGAIRLHTCGLDDADWQLIDQ